MKKLFPHFPFDPTETPQSFAARLAWLHTEGAPVRFLRDMGIKAEGEVDDVAAGGICTPETPDALTSNQILARWLPAKSRIDELLVADAAAKTLPAETQA